MQFEFKKENALRNLGAIVLAQTVASYEPRFRAGPMKMFPELSSTQQAPWPHVHPRKDLLYSTRFCKRNYSEDLCNPLPFGSRIASYHKAHR